MVSTITKVIIYFGELNFSWFRSRIWHTGNRLLLKKSEWGYLNNTFWLRNMKQLNFRHFNTNSKKSLWSSKVFPKRSKNGSKQAILFCLVYLGVFGHAFYDNLFQKTSEGYRRFPKTNEDFRRLTKRSDHCRRCLKNPPNFNSTFFGNSKH